MRILFCFTKLFGKHKAKRISVFEKTEFFQCQYLYSETYLGAKAEILFPKGDFEVSMSYSVRDGMLVKIKRNKPYKILYNYIDGKPLVPDEEDRKYTKLTKLLHNLNKEKGKYQHLHMYEKLEQIVYYYLINEFM